MWGPNTEEETKEYVAQLIEMRREHLFFKGAFHDSELYSILRQEFEA